MEKIPKLNQERNLNRSGIYPRAKRPKTVPTRSSSDLPRGASRTRSTCRGMHFEVRALNTRGAPYGALVEFTVYTPRDTCLTSAGERRILRRMEVANG